MSFTHKPLLPAEIEYLEANHHNTTVTAMADHLGRGPVTIYKWMEDKGYKTFKQPRVPDKNHPIRRKNRELERNLNHFRHIRGIQHNTYSKPLKK